MNLLCSRFGIVDVTLFIVIGGVHCHREVSVLTGISCNNSHTSVLICYFAQFLVVSTR